MKVKHVKELLDKMQTRNKDYIFIERCYEMGKVGMPIHPSGMSKLEKLADKKGIKFRPTKLQSLIYRIKMWWWLESPIAQLHMRKYKNFLSNYEPKTSRLRK